MEYGLHPFFSNHIIRIGCQKQCWNGHLVRFIVQANAVGKGGVGWGKTDGTGVAVAIGLLGHCVEDCDAAL